MHLVDFNKPLVSVEQFQGLAPPLQLAGLLSDLLEDKLFLVLAASVFELPLVDQQSRQLQDLFDFFREELVVQGLPNEVQLGGLVLRLGEQREEAVVAGSVGEDVLRADGALGGLELLREDQEALGAHEVAARSECNHLLERVQTDETRQCFHLNNQS